MLLLYTAIIALVASETFLLLPFQASVDDLQRVIGKIFRTVSSDRISDHWKERVMLRYAGQMALASCKLGLYLAILLGSVFLSGFVIDQYLLGEGSVIEFISSLAGIAYISLVSILYLIVRLRYR